MTGNRVSTVSSCRGRPPPKYTKLWSHTASESLFSLPRLETRFPNEGKQNEFLPFGTGPKSCVGQFLAMREMKAVMVKLMKDWKIELLDKEKQGVEALKVRWDIAQQPVHKIYVKLVPRESSSY